MESAPIQRPPGRQQTRRSLSVQLKVGLALSALLAIALLLINQVLHTPQAPQGIVNLQLAGNAAHTRDILQSWSPQQQAWARSSLLLDFLLVALYSATLFLLTHHLLKDRPGVRERTAGRWVLILFALAAVSDCVENLLLLNNLKEPDDLTSLVVAFSALVKFTGLLLGSAGLVIIRAARRRPLGHA
ncbi:MAG: hypothetical protein V7760_10250 [Marinobacter sp.]